MKIRLKGLTTNEAAPTNSRLLSFTSRNCNDWSQLTTQNAMVESPPNQD